MNSIFCVWKMTLTHLRSAFHVHDEEEKSDNELNSRADSELTWRRWTTSLLIRPVVFLTDFQMVWRGINSSPETDPQFEEATRRRAYSNDWRSRTNESLLHDKIPRSFFFYELFIQVLSEVFFLRIAWKSVVLWRGVKKGEALLFQHVSSISAEIMDDDDLHRCQKDNAKTNMNYFDFSGCRWDIVKWGPNDTMKQKDVWNFEIKHYGLKKN